MSLTDTMRSNGIDDTMQITLSYNIKIIPKLKRLTK